LSQKYFLDIELGCQHEMDKNTIDFIQIKLKSKNFSQYKSIIKTGIKYQIGDLLAISKKNELPIFSKLKTIIYKNSFGI
jgi:hypothetical protein